MLAVYMQQAIKVQDGICVYKSIRCFITVFLVAAVFLSVMPAVMADYKLFYTPDCSFQDLSLYKKDADGYMHSGNVCHSRLEALEEIRKFVYYRVPFFAVTVDVNDSEYGDGNTMIAEAVKEYKRINGMMSYHAWNMAGGFAYWWKNENDKSKSTLFCTCMYYSTYEEESVVSNMVSNLIGSIVSDGMSDYDKAYVICRWIHENVKYGECLHGQGHSNAAYGAIAEGKANCLGKAALLKKMCDEAGLGCQIISGEGHAWNIVRVDNKWYYVDLSGDWAFLKGSASFAAAGHQTVVNSIAAFMPLIERDDYISEQD